MGLFGRAAAGWATGGLSEGLRMLQPGSPDFSSINSLIDERRNQIKDFENRLEGSRNNLLTNQKNLATNSLNFLLPALEAKLGARGININGGAYASAATAAAMPFLNDYNKMNAELTQSNLSAVENERANLFGTALQAQGQETMIPYQAKESFKSGLLQGGLSIFGSALGSGAFKGGAGANSMSYNPSSETNYDLNSPLIFRSAIKE